MTNSQERTHTETGPLRAMYNFAQKLGQEWAGRQFKSITEQADGDIAYLQAQLERISTTQRSDRGYQGDYYVNPIDWWGKIKQGTDKLNNIKITNPIEFRKEVIYQRDLELGRLLQVEIDHLSQVSVSMTDELEP